MYRVPIILKRVFPEVPEVFSCDGVQFLSRCAVDGGLRSVLRRFQEHGAQGERQGHHRGVTHQIGPHRPRVHRVHRHVQPWAESSPNIFLFGGPSCAF